MREPRAAVMIVVEATWEDHGGTLRTTGARMENKSASGACLRMQIPIPVGSKLSTRSHKEQFSGTVKYCRSEGMEYLVGVARETPGRQTTARETTKIAAPEPPVLRPRRQLRGAVPSAPPMASDEARPPTKGKVSKPRKVAQGRAADAARVKAAARGIEPSVSTSEDVSKDVVKEPRNTPNDNCPARLETVLEAKQHPLQLQQLTEEEESFMRRKWLESALWGNKQDDVRGGSNGKGEGNSNANRDSTGANGDYAILLTPPAEKLGEDVAGDGVPRSHVEYLPMDDIYLAAGIVNLRRGYSINKVVEMLHSEHMRGLSKEMKRAALLMALDAAGISVAEVLNDARARQDALDAYEAGQRKQAEAEWGRKAEEIAQIQSELERVKEQYAARISRHLDAVSREKAAFGSWQGIKHQESQSMKEAAELCLKTSHSEAGGTRAENLVPGSSRTM